MSTHSGFLVVEKHPTENLRLGLPNTQYKGLYTTVPWDQKRYKEGWDDPLVFGDYTDERFLIRNLDLAREVLSRFAEIRPREEMEIMYVRTWEDPSQLPLESLDSEDLRFLGYDVAYDRAPFYSVVAGFPSVPTVTNLRPFLDRLNKYGLFRSPEDGRAYLDAYRAQKLLDWEETYVIWEVYLVGKRRLVV